MSADLSHRGQQDASASMSMKCMRFATGPRSLESSERNLSEQSRLLES